MSLYLKYRPKLVEELDLARVRESLHTIIKQNHVAHAYLMTGPRGAGKTSSARILARVINCEKNADKLSEPCNSCQNCLSILNSSAVDVVEIDAASNRRIDDIRELKEKIRLSPSQLRKKVYIIDEVHMLTTEAFNALLKTLEEPPSHAIFVLCTTELHKVPETIVSRTVKINFAKASEEELKRSLRRVIKGEKMDLSEEAINLIVRSVDGSFRDAVKVLDSLVGKGGKVEVKDIEKILSGATHDLTLALASALIEKNLDEALTQYRQAEREGAEHGQLFASVMREVHTKLISDIEKKSGAKYTAEMVSLIYKLDEVIGKIASSTVPAILGEAMIIDWCTKDGYEKEVVKVKSEPKKVIEKKDPEEQSSQEEEEEEELTSEDGREMWGQLISKLSGDSYSLGTLLSKARPGVIRGDVLVIEFAFDFHRQQMMQEKFRMKIEGLVSEVVGKPMRIEAVYKPNSSSLQSVEGVDRIAVSQDDTNLMEAAEEIFGN